MNCPLSIEISSSPRAAQGMTTTLAATASPITVSHVFTSFHGMLPVT